MWPSRTRRITSENRDLASYVEYVMDMGSMLSSQTSLQESLFKFAVMISIANARA